MIYLKYWPYLFIVILALGCWHFRSSASDWQITSKQQQHRAETAESANGTLATANASLNARNTYLVESLNARSDELETEKRRADANRTAYQQAVSANRDWANERVPDSVADSLRRATDRLQDGSSPETSSPQ